MSPTKVPTPDQVPTIPTELLTHKNPALRLTANMLSQGFDELRTLYTTITTYNEVTSQSEDLLSTSDNSTVVAYRQVLETQKTKDADDENLYQSQIAQFKKERDSKIQARAQQVEQDFKQPALKALQLDSSVTVEQFTTASSEAPQLASTLKTTLTTLVNQAKTSASDEILNQLNQITVPTVSGSLSSGDAPVFTPKFSRARINSELVPDNKLKAADLAKRLNISRDNFVKALAAPWRGNTSIWKDSEPGFVHTFTVTVNDNTYTVEVVKAARTINKTVPQDDTTVDVDNEVTSQDDAPNAPINF